MATLSASRRNSAVSTTTSSTAGGGGSIPNSPRPSISGMSSSMFNAPAVPMGSLHEEDDDFSIELPAVVHQDIPRRSPKVVTKSQCSERSDSGYSECSNCSASGSLQCQCANKDSVDHATASDLLQDLSISVPHDLLKLKLEEIAHQADHNIEEVKLELVVPTTEKLPQLDANQNELKSLEMPDKEPPHTITVIEDVEVLNSSPGGPIIMRSDFTNTIQMRKKSLENSLLKEKPKPTSKSPLYEKSGKVNMLRNKFSCMEQQVSSAQQSAAVKSKDCMDVLKLKRKVINEACLKQSNCLLIFYSNNLNKFSIFLCHSNLSQPSNILSLLNTLNFIAQLTDTTTQDVSVYYVPAKRTCTRGNRSLGPTTNCLHRG